MPRRWIAAALLATSLAAAAPAQTSLLEQARVARFAGRIDDAERLLVRALRTEPANYLALYNMGLVYEARAVGAAPGEARVRHYRTAAGWLEKANAQRIRAKVEDFTIFNSLGTMYLGIGDLGQADRYLSEGLRNEKRLNDFSRGRLYANYGYLCALRGDNKKALVYFRRGAALGSAAAQENLGRLQRASAY